MTSQCLRQLQLADDIIIQGHRIEVGGLKLSVYTVTGAQDVLEVPNTVIQRVPERITPKLSNTWSSSSSGLL